MELHEKEQMTEDAPPPESPTQATFTIKEKCMILGISSSSFDRYRKLGMPTDDPDEAMSWIQRKRRRRWYSFRAKSRHTMLRLRRISREGWKWDAWDG